MSDLISREDAIKVFIDWGMKEFGYHDFNRNERFIDAINALPSAEAVQSDGKMIPIELKKRYPHSRDKDITDAFMRGYQAHAEAVGWIPCSERLPKVNQRVLLATNGGQVFVGYREKPDLVWQVTEKDGRKHWVYDPENYTDDIEILPKNEDCGFSKDDFYSDGFMSVTSVNYDDRFVGVTAWMPLPKPYTKGDNDEER